MRTRSSADADKPAAMRLEVSQSHEICTISYVRYSFLLVCNSNIVLKTRRFSVIRLQKNAVTLKSGSKVTQGHRHWHEYRSATYDFLLMLHSNHEPISYRFRDKWRFQSKITNFSHPVYLTPRWRGSLELGFGARGRETRVMHGYQMVKKVLR